MPDERIVVEPKPLYAGLEPENEPRDTPPKPRAGCEYTWPPLIPPFADGRPTDVNVDGLPGPR
jgi:hypothetical protein